MSSQNHSFLEEQKKEIALRLLDGFKTENGLCILEPGIHRISNEDYHASKGISRSGISEIKTSPLHYWDKYLNPDKPKKPKSSAMEMGTLVGTLLTEPHNFEKYFIVVKKVNGATKEGKAYKKSIEEETAGRIQMTEPEYKKSLIMVEAIKRHQKAMRILEGAEFEPSIYWVDKETGLLCKTRPDIWNKEIGILCDLKTSRKPCPYEFAQEAINHDYHIQAAMQIDGIYENTGVLIEDFCFLTIPNIRPFSAYLYHMPAAMIDRGRREYKAALKIAKICFDKNQWDLEREIVLPMDFSDHQISKNSFHQLTEIYNVRINY